MRSSAKTLGWVLGVLLFGGSLPVVATESGPKGVSEEVLHRVQLACLQAYPGDLIAEMTDGETRLPPDLESDPENLWENLYPLMMQKGEFFPTILQDLVPLFTRYVSAGQRFLDLGSGDGRVVFLANLLGADAYGIEYEERLIETSRRAQEALSDLIDPERIHLIRGDFFEFPWSDYDVIFYFNRSSSDEDRFHSKLISELKPGARLIVSAAPASIDGLQLVEQGRGINVFEKAAR